MLVYNILDDLFSPKVSDKVFPQRDYLHFPSEDLTIITAYFSYRDVMALTKLISKIQYEQATSGAGQMFLCSARFADPPLSNRIGIDDARLTIYVPVLFAVMSRSSTPTPFFTSRHFSTTSLHFFSRIHK